MSTERQVALPRRVWLGAALLTAVPAAWTQVLSSPMPGVTPATPGSGQGLGTHGANSPFPPLQPRADVVPWSLLGEVKTRVDGKKLVPVFSPQVMALHQKSQRVQGFMMPLEPGERQRHFLISSVPLTCSFCTPGGPESIIEVRTREPVRYAMEAVVIEGRLQVLVNDPYGVYYRITDGVAVK